MRVLRPSSLREYAAWYLRREAQKGRTDRIPDNPEEQVQQMCERHSGKIRPWFTQGAGWTAVSLDSLRDFASLVFLECSWTRDEGLVIPDGSPNYRVLERVAKNAIASGYLSRPSARRHGEYYAELLAGRLRLESEARIAICSAEASERRLNPAAHYYLLDGVGRSLPYMVLVLQKELDYVPVEAFLAEQQ